MMVMEELSEVAVPPNYGRVIRTLLNKAFEHEFSTVLIIGSVFKSA